MNNLNGAIATWRQRIAGRPTSLNGMRDWATYDAAERATWQNTRTAARRRAYEKSVPARYRSADYQMLVPHQDPDGLVSRWLASTRRSLVLAGPSRTGKTTAAYAIANDAHARGLWVVARSAIALSAALKPGGDPAAEHQASTCDLLIIDDLGRERMTDWWLERLHGIADHRCNENLRVIVTTNCDSLEDLGVVYTDPLVERLSDGGGMVRIDGPLMRDFQTRW